MPTQGWGYDRLGGGGGGRLEPGAWYYDLVLRVYYIIYTDGEEVNSVSGRVSHVL